MNETNKKRRFYFPYDCRNSIAVKMIVSFTTVVLDSNVYNSLSVCAVDKYTSIEIVAKRC